MRGFVIGCLLFAACNREYSISPKEEPVDSDDPGLSIEDPQDGLPDVDTDDPPVDTEVEDTDVEVDTDVTDTAQPDDTAIPQVDTGGPPVDTAPIVPIDTFPPIDTGIVPTLPIYNLASDLQWPESGDWDPVGRAFFVSSLTEGHVLRVDALGESVFYEDSAATLDLQTYGVKADVARRKLYVCARESTTPFASWYLWVIDLDTGARLHAIDMDTSRTRAQCRDFAVAANGSVFITDRSSEQIHVYNPTLNTISVFADHPLLDGLQWGLDGIVVTPAQDAIIANVSKPPNLLRVDMLDPTQVTEISLTGTGYGLQAGHGLDGMYWFNGDLWVAAVNRMLQITPDDPTWTSATRTVFEAPIDGVSALTVADGELYGINGDPFAYALGIQADLPFEIYRVTFPLTPAPP